MFAPSQNKNSKMSAQTKRVNRIAPIMIKLRSFFRAAFQSHCQTLLSSKGGWDGEEYGNPSRAEAQPPKVMALSTMEIVSYSFFFRLRRLFFCPFREISGRKMELLAKWTVNKLLSLFHGIETTDLYITDFPAMLLFHCRINLENCVKLTWKTKKNI